MFDTFGWDLVYGATLAGYDIALQASGKVPESFAVEGAAGHYASWHLVAGAPSNRQLLQITLADGTARVSDHDVPIGGTQVTALVQLAIGSDGVIAPLGGDAILLDTYKLPVTVAEGDVYAIAQLLDRLVKADVPKIAGAFGSISLNAGTGGGSPLWLVPTSAQLASQPLATGDPRGAVVAILAMTQGRDSDGLQPAVDSRIFDGAPAQADRALAIGNGHVTANLILPAITALVQGAQQSDFQASLTGTVYNKATTTWGKYSFTGSDGTASEIQPRIPAGNLQLTLNGGTLHLSMSNINFAYPGWSGPGDIMVAFDAEQFAPIGIFGRTDGQLVIGQAGDGTRSFSATVIPSQKTQIFQIALNAALQLLFALIGGALDSAAGAAENAASGSIEEGAEDSLVSSFDAEDVQGLLEENASTEEIEAAEAAAAEDAGNALVNADEPGWVEQFKSALMANRYKILLKIIEKAVETPAGKIVDTAIALAKSQYDDLPSINPLIAAAAAPVTWAGGSGADFVAGRVDGALLLWARSAGLSKRGDERQEAMRPYIMITCELASLPGKAAEADVACGALVRAANLLEGMTARWRWSVHGARVEIDYEAQSSDAVLKHILDHGGMYAGLAGLCTVVRFRVNGPAGDAALAAFRRLTPNVEVA